MKKLYLITLCIVALAGATIVQAAGGHVKHITTQQEVDDARTSGKPVIIKIHALWCGPCKKMEPELEAFAAKNTDIIVLSLDADQNKALADQLSDESPKDKSKGYPTTLFYDATGKLVEKTLGYIGEESIALRAQGIKNGRSCPTQAGPMPPTTTATPPASTSTTMVARPVAVPATTATSVSRAKIPRTKPVATSRKIKPTAVQTKPTVMSRRELEELKMSAKKQRRRDTRVMQRGQ